MPINKAVKDKIVFIVGPTAIGKTRLSVKLANKMNSCVISADSMQIYKGMSVLSQAPDIKERRGVKHHLIGKLDPGKEYSVASFIKDATGVINSTLRQKKIPVIAGGSGLYVKSLVDGIFPAPKADAKYRTKMHKTAVKKGTKALHEELRRIDPASAANIHPNDERRIIRALEIYHSTGRTMSDLKSETKGLKDIYDIKMFGLTRPREEMYSEIDDRTEKMFRLGIVKEVKRLMKKRISKTAGAALGFKEIRGFLKGEYELSEAKELLKKNTRNFAKRQLTWFRSDDRVKWFDVSKLSDDEIIRKIAASIKKDRGKNLNPKS